MVMNAPGAAAPAFGPPSSPFGASAAAAPPVAQRAPQPARVGGDDAAVKTVHREGPKVGRNDPCPCGSGKKYKKCHGAAA
jgi:preprotein translocase subunit SecA